MIRTQVQLTEEQAGELKRLAAERGVSMAQLIREGVDSTLRGAGSARDWDRARSVLGKYRSGAADVSEQHDRYLADAFGD